MSVFGGPAWTRVVEPDGNPGQWYLHLFDAEQPDLNWDNPEVFDDLEKTLRFWLERGVDGFRIDVAHGMAKPPGLPDMEITDSTDAERSATTIRGSTTKACTISTAASARCSTTIPTRWRSARSGCIDNRGFAEYLRPDELHLGFNFRLLQAEFDAAAIREAIENSLAAVALAGAPPTWTLSNHDVERKSPATAAARSGWRARGRWHW